MFEWEFDLLGLIRFFNSALDFAVLVVLLMRLVEELGRVLFSVKGFNVVVLVVTLVLVLTLVCSFLRLFVSHVILIVVLVLVEFDLALTPEICIIWTIGW